MLKDAEIAKLLESLNLQSLLSSEDIPNIDLYMDQVTTFMEENLDMTKRHNDDKILTKTMINNYAKNRLLPPPVKKKYSREHLLLMIFIYFLKGFLSLSDIQTLLRPLNAKYFENPDGINVVDIYNEISALCQTENPSLKADLLRQYEKACQSWSMENAALSEKISEEELDLLQSFSLLSMLSYDVYIKKMMIEHLIDLIADTYNATDPRHDRKK